MGPFDKAQGRRRWSWAWLGLMLAAVCATADDGVPADDCAICHDELVPAFAESAHGKAMSARSAEFFQTACVACHGPGETHIEEGTAETIVGKPGPEACQGCHAGMGSKTELLTPSHQRQGVTCVECHDPGHQPAGFDKLLRDEPRRMCSSCHLQQAGAFRLPFAHRNGNEGFDCTACHTAHGDTRVGRLTLDPDSNACVDCHSERSRPFVFPHPPAQHSGCTSCHRPHGSPNPRMLTRPTVQLLCLECHANVPSFHDVTSSRYRNCLNCHTAVHGSNRDPRLIEE